MKRLLGIPFRRIGERKWDIFLRTTGVAGLIGIPIAINFPDAIPLVWLSVVGIPANSPLGPIIPTAFEPLIMEAAKYRGALEVAVVATAIYMYMEFVNWHVYSWVLSWEKLESLQEKKWVDRGMRWFARSPFWAIIFFAATPIPFWVARCLAILNRYPIGTFMIATTIGRFPRLFLYAWLGELLAVSTGMVIAAIIVPVILIIGVKLAHGKRILEDTILDTGGPPPSPPKRAPEPITD